MAYDGEIKELSVAEVDSVSGGLWLAVVVVVGLVAAYMAGQSDGKADTCTPA